MFGPVSMFRGRPLPLKPCACFDAIKVNGLSRVNCGQLFAICAPAAALIQKAFLSGQGVTVLGRDGDSDAAASDGNKVY